MTARFRSGQTELVGPCEIAIPVKYPSGLNKERNSHEVYLSCFFETLSMLLGDLSSQVA